MVDCPRVLHSVCYARNHFTILGNSTPKRFFTTGRAIYAFDETNTGAKFAVLDTFYGAEFFVTHTLGEKIKGRVLDCFQVAEGANTRTALLVLVACDPVAKVQLTVQKVDVDFEQKTFVAHAPTSVVSQGGVIAPEPARRWIHPTANPQVLYISVLQRQKVHFFRYDREKQEVARLPFLLAEDGSWTAHDVHVHSGRVFVLKRKDDRLRLVADNKRGGWPNIGADLSHAFKSRKLVSSFLCGDYVYVLLKDTEKGVPAKIFRISLANDEKADWETVDCADFAAVPWALWTSAFVDGVLCIHPVQRHTLGPKSVDVFYSVRIPVEQPELLSNSTWFEALKRNDLVIEVLQRGPTRPLTTSGVCLNKVSFVTPEQLHIYRDLDVEQCLAAEDKAVEQEDLMETSTSEAQWWWNRELSDAAEMEMEEDDDLQQAILNSILQASAAEAARNQGGAGPSGSHS
ncbi:hypothetical protein M3Y99_00523200 [Aphelenchoides fujianensis]|nr:hypothetical protein M3Y99_00523200 [Aphelenchoides fujianensis]